MVNRPATRWTRTPRPRSACSSVSSPTADSASHMAASALSSSRPATDRRNGHRSSRAGRYRPDPPPDLVLRLDPKPAAAAPLAKPRYRQAGFFTLAVGSGIEDGPGNHLLAAKWPIDVGAKLPVGLGAATSRSAAMQSTSVRRAPISSLSGRATPAGSPARLVANAPPPWQFGRPRVGGRRARRRA
jgi:hypothetical protein